MELNLQDFGIIVYTLPASLFIYIFRELIRNFILKFFNQEFMPAISYIDPLAVFSLSFFGVSWGGLIGNSRKDNIITFLISQVWFLVYILLLVFFLFLKQSSNGSMLFLTIHYSVKFSWILFILNFLPIPPFDASSIYMQPLENSTIGKVISSLSKIVFIIIIAIFYTKNIDQNFLFSNDILQFLGLGFK